jgi:hypothetical protein
MGRKRAGRWQFVPSHCLLPIGRRAARHHCVAAGGVCPGNTRAHRRRQRHQSADPARDAWQLGHAAHGGRLGPRSAADAAAGDPIRPGISAEANAWWCQGLELRYSTTRMARRPSKVRPCMSSVRTWIKWEPTGRSEGSVPRHKCVEGRGRGRLRQGGSGIAASASKTR